MSDNQQNSLSDRLDRLSNENCHLRRQMRQVKVLFIGASIVVLGSAVMFQNIGRFEKGVEVFDGNGNVRAVMYADNGQNKSGLEIRDQTSRVRLAVETNKNDDPFIRFMDANGRNRIEMGISIDGTAYLVLRRQDGQEQRFLAP